MVAQGRAIKIDGDSARTNLAPLEVDESRRPSSVRRCFTSGVMCMRHTESRRPSATPTRKKQQSDFASWLSLQNSKGRKIPFCWHATNSRSKATPGTPDFWVGINGRVCGSSSSGTAVASYRPSKRSSGRPARLSALSTTSCIQHRRRSNSWRQLLRFGRSPRSGQKGAVPVSGSRWPVCW